MNTSWKQVSAAVFVAFFAMVPRMADACVITYLDFNVDTAQEEVDAWSYIEDCDMEIGYYYEHYYTAYARIESPTGYSVSNSDYSQMPYGGGSADAFRSIPFCQHA